MLRTPTIAKGCHLEERSTVSRMMAGVDLKQGSMEVALRTAPSPTAGLLEAREERLCAGEADDGDCAVI